MTDSDFNRRPGGYRFPAFSGPMDTWSSAVQEWADRKRVHLEFRITQSGPAHSPTFTAVPYSTSINAYIRSLYRLSSVVDGVPHPEYQGVGSSAKAAKNQACERIGRSGHCVSEFFIFCPRFVVIDSHIYVVNVTATRAASGLKLKFPNRSSLPQ